MPVDGESAARFFKDRLGAAGTAERAAGMKAYMKSDLSFFGVDQKQLRAACADFAKAHAKEDIAVLLPALDELISSRWFEMQAAAIGVLERRRKALGPEHLDTLVDWVRRTACWAHVDWIATKLVGAVLAAHPKELGRLARWAKDEEMWVRRTAIICQLDELRAGRGDFDRLVKVSVPLLEEKEFFIRKAIGWALRDVSKKRPDLVRAYLAEHGDRASGLTRREASKYI
jgi:3-methyladenine DNA glycosylase AlkD